MASSQVVQDQKSHLTKGQLYVIEGMSLAKSLNPSELPLSPSDTIICSSPKSGTTWLKSLVFSIVTRTRFDVFSENHPILASVSHDLVPFIEIEIAHRCTSRDPELPLLSTHMPFSGLPDTILDSGCKIVYICRNPKDVFVSYWHFSEKILHRTVSMEESFDLFCKGKDPVFGSYWDHVLGYWKARLEDPKRIMFLKYEDMMGDPISNVERLAEFIGYGFSNDERESDVVERIVEMCSFENLSKLEVNKSGKHRGNMLNSIFFRKAKVGDWTNYLTPEMANKIDEITIQKLASFGLAL